MELLSDATIEPSRPASATPVPTPASSTPASHLPPTGRLLAVGSPHGPPKPAPTPALAPQAVKPDITRLVDVAELRAYLGLQLLVPLPEEVSVAVRGGAGDDGAALSGACGTASRPGLAGGRVGATPSPLPLRGVYWTVYALCSTGDAL